MLLRGVGATDTVRRLPSLQADPHAEHRALAVAAGVGHSELLENGEMAWLLLRGRYAITYPAARAPSFSSLPIEASKRGHAARTPATPWSSVPRGRERSCGIP